MNIPLVLIATKRWFTHLDSKIRITLDRILPRNLTIRYIAALSTIGVLSILGQIVVQLALTRLEDYQKKLRTIEIKIQDSESVRKAAFALHLNSNKPKTQDQFEGILDWLSRLENSQQFISTDVTQLKIQIDSPPDLPKLAESEKRAISRINQNFWHLHSVLLDKTSLHESQIENQINTLAQDLLNNETLYGETLRALAHFYEQQLIQQTNDSHQLELFFLMATLSLLIVEALYVFRPGVESLYEALRTRSDFLGRMGHEIRNPMNSIIGMTNLLFETPLTDQQKKYLSTLRKSSGSLLEMLNNLLDFSTAESKGTKLEKIPFNLYDLVERSIDLAVFGAHAHGLELILDLGFDVPLRLKGDPTRLQQILANLLGNALKFTKQGEVTLQVQLMKHSEDPLIQFSIIDTGMGIDKKKIQQIFNPFVQEDSTVRRRFGGSGLGLSIANDLVKLMEGTLAVESEKNIGSRFYFTIPLPIEPKSAQGENIDQLIIQKQQLDNFDAMILEPNARVSSLLESLVQKMGGTTSRINDQSEILRLFSSFTKSNQTKSTIFIVDYEFIKGSLNDLFSIARRSDVNFSGFIFLIKTTASSSELEKLADYGVNNFLFKPVKPIQLIELVGYAITGKKETKVIVEQEELVHDHRNLRVLAADDSKDNQFLIKAYLESLPYRLVFADNGLIAFQKFKESRFDIILMDLQMPEMDGYSAVEAIRQWEESENMRPIPIIAVTAHDNEYETKRFRDAGFSGYLLKPINPNQIRREILKFTHGIKQIPQSIAPADSIATLEKRLGELAPGYIRNRRKDLIELKKYIEASDFKQIAILGHRTKGSAKSYGFEELGNLGSELEEAAKEMDLDKTQTAVFSMESFLTRAPFDTMFCD